MLLRIENLTINVKFRESRKQIVSDLSLTIAENQMVGLVGGSGSGKSTTGLAILRLLAPQLEISSGTIYLKEKNVLAFDEGQMQSVRGKEIGMVFQEPLDAFNPVFTVGYQIAEVLRFHTGLAAFARGSKVQELLDQVGIVEPARVMRSYPHQLSGGMRQRAMIAQAIAANPKLIVADEPTSNLDVTLQAKIMELFQKLVKDFDLSILLITHDLGVVRHLTEKVYVMTEGKVVESGLTKDVLSSPAHAYTQKLMGALEV